MKIVFDLSRLSDSLIELFLEFVLGVFGDARETFGWWLLAVLTAEQHRRTQARMGGRKIGPPKALVLNVYPDPAQAAYLERALGEIFLRLARLAAEDPNRAEEFCAGSELCLRIVVALREVRGHAQRLQGSAPN